jgi:phosphatidylserine/phosphatidylglycerophosphate/cardiolipin synthase-like enzyme
MFWLNCGYTPLTIKDIALKKISLTLVMLLAGITAALLLAGCATSSKAPMTVIPSVGYLEEVGTLEFLESFPEETSFDMAEFPEAHSIWPQVFAGAKKSIDVASFYFSRQGDGEDAAAPTDIPDLLGTSLQGLKQAAERSCKVQVLGDEKFFSTYPQIISRFNTWPGVEAKTLNAGRLWDGVLHAKYFVVDDQKLYVGSQNWDWRAMNQIRELGALVSHRGLATDLKRIFTMDWELADAVLPEHVPEFDESDYPVTPGFDQLNPVQLVSTTGDTVTAVLAASPARALPEGIAWDLPLLIELIDSAKESVNFQLLSYNVSDRQGRLFDDLDSALRRAAARKVKVRIILANWSKVNYKLSWIKSLAAVYRIEVKFSNIPENSQGFIPFARVEHAKYLTVDGKAAWVGTSNWSRDYFHNSRNISLFFKGAGAAGPLEKFFAKSWNSQYTETVDLGAEYAPPKRN